MKLMRLATFAAMTLLCASAFADCREASGGKLQDWRMPVAWHARMACGGSTLLWFQSVAGTDGNTPVWRVDDLLIIPDQEGAQTLSLAAARTVDCRHGTDRSQIVFALGDWGRGGRRPAYRAWRLDPATNKVEELPPGDVTCVVR